MNQNDSEKLSLKISEHEHEIRWLRESIRGLQKFFGQEADLPPGWCWMRHVTVYGFSVEAIRRRIIRGEIKGEWIGSRRIVKIAEIEALARKKEESRRPRRAA